MNPSNFAWWRADDVSPVRRGGKWDHSHERMWRSARRRGRPRLGRQDVLGVELAVAVLVLRRVRETAGPEGLGLRGAEAAQSPAARLRGWEAQARTRGPAPLCPAAAAHQEAALLAGEGPDVLPVDDDELVHLEPLRARRRVEGRDWAPAGG